ncbi:hypothetical protein EYR38_006388 [Pleurotus pulmonarius]|nr:hypothetical protein EYR38_006388 [Pleurotus pulmonarius]
MGLGTIPLAKYKYFLCRLHKFKGLLVSSSNSTMKVFNVLVASLLLVGQVFAAPAADIDATSEVGHSVSGFLLVSVTDGCLRLLFVSPNEEGPVVAAQGMVGQDVVGQEMADQDVEDQETGDRVAVDQEMEDQDVEGRATGDQGVEDQETEDQDMADPEMGGQDTEGQEMAAQETEGQDAADRGTVGPLVKDPLPSTLPHIAHLPTNLAAQIPARLHLSSEHSA